MCCAGYRPDISYCPNCGNNNWSDRVNWNCPDPNMVNPKTYQYKEPIFKCDCGWKGTQSTLFTKIQYLKTQRKLKMRAITESMV